MSVLYRVGFVHNCVCTKKQHEMRLASRGVHCIVTGTAR